MRLSALVLVASVAACGTDDVGDVPDDIADDGKGDGPLDPAWDSIGLGEVTTGHAIVIAYGGYSARISDSAAWASELVDARLGAVDVGHIFAVKGPADASYSGREIANTKLRAHLQMIDDGVSSIYVVAHSSGSFVAHELLAQIHATGDEALLARISYANLDGGGSGLTLAIAETLANLSFVYARDPIAGLSQNAGTAKSLGAAYAPHGAAFEVTVPTTGCASGAGWCLHDVVITHRPHNPSSYDLARDYTDFVDRPVTTEYLEPFL